MEKKLSWIEILTTTLFAMSYQMISDIYLTEKFKMYGYFEKNKIDFESLLFIFLVYPFVNSIFLNYYPYKKSWIRKTMYILIASLIAVLFEWTYIKTGTFYHNHWKLWYSAILYPIIFLVLVIFHTITKKLLKHYLITNVYKRLKDIG